jgi:hypothetical protein
MLPPSPVRALQDAWGGSSFPGAELPMRQWGEERTLNRYPTVGTNAQAIGGFGP